MAAIVLVPIPMTDSSLSLPVNVISKRFKKGFSAVPHSRLPCTIIQRALKAKSRLSQTRAPLTVSVAADTFWSRMMVWPRGIRISVLSAGTAPPQVAGSDQRVATLVSAVAMLVSGASSKGISGAPVELPEPPPQADSTKTEERRTIVRERRLNIQ